MLSFIKTKDKQAQKIIELKLEIEKLKKQIKNG